MSVLTFKSEEFKTFPPILREYASQMNVIKGNSEKTVCEYLLDLRTFFRYYYISYMIFNSKHNKFTLLNKIKRFQIINYITFVLALQ